MLRKRHLVILAILVSAKILADLLFKVHYRKEDIYAFNHLALDRNTVIENGIIVCGHNIKGKIEASVFPADSNGEVGISRKKIEYAYLRFNPDHFKQVIAPTLEKTEISNASALKKKARINHRNHFRRFAHLNDYPLIRENHTPYVIQYRDPDQLIIQNDMKR